MKITFLGTSHGFCEKNRFCSSAAVTVGNKTYIIDAGAPIMGLLKNYDIPYTSVAGIFITHSHQDHYGGLVEFMDQIEGFGQYKDVRINVHVPPEFPSGRINTYLFGDPEGKNRIIPGGNQKAGENKENRIEFVTYPDGEIFNDGIMKITSIPVKHIEHAHAFLLECEGKRVLFSGDLTADFCDYPNVLTAGEGVDLLILEAAHSLYDKPENISLFRRTKTKRMLVNHIYEVKNTPSVMQNMINAVKDLYPVEIAYDGMEVMI